MRAMILAAGRGERMGALTERVPKPLLEVGGEALIVRQLRRLAAAGVAEVVVNLSYRGEQIRTALGDGAWLGLSIHYSQEPDRPLETAGGIVQALPWLGRAPFLLCNADVVTDFDYARIARADADGVLVLAPNPAHHPAGDYGLDADGRLSTAPPKLTYTGLGLFSPALFAGLRPGRRPLVEILDRAVAAKRLKGVLHEGLWIDVGTPERLEAARQALAARAPD